MKKLIIGALLLLIGIPGFSFNVFNFLIFAAGLVPVLMIIGGAFAVYLGIKNLKQSNNSDNQEKVESPHTQPEERNKESTGTSEGQAQQVPGIQSVKLAPETKIKTEEKSADEQDADKQLEAQPEPEEKAPITSTSCSRITGPPAPEKVSPIVASVQFKGNIETLVFHSIACNFASGKNCSMDFTTKEEAEAQGYKPCKICMTEA